MLLNLISLLIWLIYNIPPNEHQLCWVLFFLEKCLISCQIPADSGESFQGNSWKHLHYQSLQWYFTTDFGINYSFAGPDAARSLTRCHSVIQLTLLKRDSLESNLPAVMKGEIGGLQQGSGCNHRTRRLLLYTWLQDWLSCGAYQWIRGLWWMPCTCDAVG